MHLGTNDYAMNVLDADFYTAYQAFVRRIRREYPKAYIVLAAGGGTTRHLDLLQRVADVCRERDKDTRVGCFVGVYTDADVAEGADGHPSSAGHRQLAEQLTGVFEGNPELVTRKPGCRRFYIAINHRLYPLEGRRISFKSAGAHGSEAIIRMLGGKDPCHQRLCFANASPSPARD